MLIFPLKKEWYEKIKRGEKSVEYREVKPYWSRRLSLVDALPEYDCITDKTEWNAREWGGRFNNSPYCKLRLGYTKEYLTARITKIEVINGKDTDLHIDKPVYAIHLTDIEK